MKGMSPVLGTQIGAGARLHRPSCLSVCDPAPPSPGGGTGAENQAGLARKQLLEGSEGQQPPLQPLGALQPLAVEIWA